MKPSLLALHPYNPHRRNRLLALAAMLAAVVFLLAPLPLPLTAPAERHFRVEAGSFEYTPAILRVNPGDHVTIDVVAQDVVHGIYIDGYDLSVSADPGQTARLSFTAARAGAFRFRCSVTCGPLHPFMIGKLYVGPNMLYWKAAALSGLAVLSVLFLVWKRPSL
jgi:plastocyanin